MQRPYPIRLLLVVVSAVLAGCRSRHTGTLRVDWSFAGSSCDRAGVLKIDAQLDGDTHLWFGCRDERDQSGATFRDLSVGAHRLELTGSGIRGVKLWTFAQAGIEIAADQESHLDADFVSTGAEDPIAPQTPAMRMEDAPQQP